MMKTKLFVFVLLVLVATPGFETLSKTMVFAQLADNGVKYLMPDSIPFVAAANYGAGSDPGSVFCSDSDGDTDLDLVVANYNSDNVSILMKQTSPYFIRGDANGDQIINVGGVVFLVTYLYRGGVAPAPF